MPSATETLVALGVPPVACTRFCPGEGLPTVGGTKDPDLEAVIRLAPDLVVMNDEENRLEDAVRLRAAGLGVHEISPRTVAEVGPAVADLAEAVAAPIPSPFAEPQWSGFLARLGPTPEPPIGAFVAIWRRPWMTLSGDTYGSSVLGRLGLSNVFSDEARRYPTVTLEQAADRRPPLVLLPSEPYPFRERHLEEVRGALPGAQVLLVDGQDLFWWGIRTPEAIGRLRARLQGSGTPVD